MKKFNSATDNRFDYLKVVGVDVFVKSCRIDVKVIYPKDKKSEVAAYSEYIVRSFKEAISSNATVDVTLTMSHFDLEFFKTGFLKFFSAYPSVDSFVFADNLSSEKTDEGYSVKFRIARSAYDYISEKGIDKKLDDYLFANYCEKVDFKFIPIEEKSEVDAIDEFSADTPTMTLINPEEGRYIRPENVEEYLGSIIYDRAEYIADCLCEKPQAVVCGTVSRFTESRRRPKDGEDEGKVFYKFTLEDFTGQISCLIFPRKNNGEKIAQLKDGKQVVVRGAVRSNVFRGETTYSLFVSDLSLCTLPSEFRENRFLRLVEKEYKVVKPRPYIEEEQIFLFEKRKETPSYLRGKTFVVFDLETTGTQVGVAKITQIAALKIVDGVFKETFMSFVNPHEPLSEKIVSLTGITDEMLATAPDAEPVLDDFRKFSDGAILVGHNIEEFDVPILNDRGKKFHIEFRNDIVDTLSLSRTLIKGLKNYKLNTIVEYFGFSNERAHRADSDVLANAHAFVELSRLIK